MQTNFVQGAINNEYSPVNGNTSVIIARTCDLIAVNVIEINCNTLDFNLGSIMSTFLYEPYLQFSYIVMLTSNRHLLLGNSNYAIANTSLLVITTICVSTTRNDSTMAKICVHSAMMPTSLMCLAPVCVNVKEAPDVSFGTPNDKAFLQCILVHNSSERDKSTILDIVSGNSTDARVCNSEIISWLLSIRDSSANTYGIKSRSGFLGEIYNSLHNNLKYSTINWKYCDRYCHSPGPRGLPWITYFVDDRHKELDCSAFIIFSGIP